MSAKVLQKVLLVSMCLMLMAFVFPQTVLASEHEVYVFSALDMQPVQGIQVSIAVWSGGNWQYDSGETNQQGSFIFDIEEDATAIYWTFWIIEPGWADGPIDVYYPDIWEEYEIFGRR